MQAVATRPRWLSILSNRPLMMLMLGHFTVDMYVGLLVVLYPLLIAKYQINLQTVGLVSLAYSGMASISQPLFGWLADRRGTRLIGLTMMWTGITFALLGLVPSFPMLLLLAGASGIGSGAFHPLGALAAADLIPPGQRNLAMSIYVTGGTVGVALGPLIGALIFTVFGTTGTLFMLLPGLLIGLVLLRDAGQNRLKAKQPRSTLENHVRPNLHPPVAVIPLIMVILMMMMRAWTLSSLQSFIPAWYESMGYSAAFYSTMTTTLIMASAIGSIWCGTLADRFGRRSIVLASLIFSIAPIFLFAHFPGPFGYVNAALIGLSAASTGPLMLVMAQQLMAGRAGLASGLILGLGFVTGALGVPVTGWIADQFGMVIAIETQIPLVIITIIMALFLPSEARMRALTRPPLSAEPETRVAASSNQVADLGSQ